MRWQFVSRYYARPDRPTLSVFGTTDTYGFGPMSRPRPTKGAAMQTRKQASKPIVIGLAVAVAVVAGLYGSRALQAQVPGFKRVELERHDIAYPGHEVVMA